MTTQNLAAAITEKQAAEQSGLDVRTLAGMRRQGKGPRHFRIGRRVRYLPADVRTWLDAHAVDGDTE